MSHQPIKIQINSLEALNRLIGGDTELELELRQSVAMAFVKKALAKELPEAVSKLLANQASTQFVKDLLTPYTTEAIKKSMDKIDMQVDIAANRIAEELTQTVLTRRLETLVDAKIKEKLGLK